MLLLGIATAILLSCLPRSMALVRPDGVVRLLISLNLK